MNLNTTGRDHDNVVRFPRAFIDRPQPSDRLSTPRAEHDPSAFRQFAWIAGGIIASGYLLYVVVTS